MMGNKEYCYPLTITDFASRYLIACEGQQSTKEQYAFTVFENAFKEYGLPDGIRTDNGVPFASPMSMFNLSRLSVWWLRLGIKIERIKPGHPEQNGRHERMHLTPKRKPQNHRDKIFYNSRQSSTNLLKSLIMKDLTKRSQ
jgi:putative transposase